MSEQVTGHDPGCCALCNLTHLPAGTTPNGQESVGQIASYRAIVYGDLDKALFQKVYPTVASGSTLCRYCHDRAMFGREIAERRYHGSSS